MNLEDSASHKASPGTRRDRGYAMAALLVAMAVMAIVMSVALPAWKHTLQREKEEELLFRGNQYARAINQYQRINANASPPTFEVLIEQHLLRKKFKDPVSPNEDGEFQPLYVAQAAGRQAGPGQAAGRQAGPGAVLSGTQSGGIMGVVSKSTAESIRLFNGKNHYNEWQFVALVQSTQAGTTGQDGPQGPAGRGPTQPPGRGPTQPPGRGPTQPPGRGTQNPQTPQGR